MSLISHLDLLKIFEMALRRSELPVSYSGGFHPLPRLRIALALPLGIEANGEWMDIDFFKDIEAQEMLTLFQRQLPNGLKLINSESIPISASNLSQVLEGATWIFELGTESKSKINWQDGLSKLIASESLMWRDTDKKGRPRELECRPLLKSIILKKKIEKEKEFFCLKSNRIELKTYIDQMGRSIKPIQVKLWLEEYFDQSLIISSVIRDEIHLLKC